MKNLLPNILNNIEIYADEQSLPYHVEKNLFISVKKSDIERLEKIVPIPRDLLFFWKNVGYGFIQYNSNGESCNQINRLLDPLSIYEILTYTSEQVSSNFILDSNKIPFFECSSEYFLYFKMSDIVKEKQAIYWYFNDEKVAESIEDFLEKIFYNPNYLYE